MKYNTLKGSPLTNKKGEILPGLQWPELIPGTLIKRYKRFLADVKLLSGEIVTAHCANSGTMKECSEPGRKVYLSYHDNPKRKLKYTWEMIEMPTSLVGVNTLVPNRLVQNSIEHDLVKELKGYDKIKPEVKAGEHSRLDFLLTKENSTKCYIEVKNCTLVSDGRAYFPDAVTSRGLKHLIELQNLVSKDIRCVMFYLVQRMDAKIFKPADHIDPAYGKELRQAVKNGIEILVYDVYIDLEKIVLGKKIDWHL
jgi:sugar fermentation stimulation protein A